MAKGGDKRRLEQNAGHLHKLRLLIAAANVAFVVARLVLKRSSAGKLLYVGWAATAAVTAVCYRAISSALSPVYGPGGELEYIGDLSTGGALSYIHDVVYIALFVQLAGCFTDYAWLAFLLVPGYAAYALAVNVLIPYWQQPRMPKDMPETEAEQKRREKRERQEARAAKFGGGRR